eukprot:m.242906 g.242906  ORF g.242906 m.242906 type:complete len:76 (-) comp17139_c0_seq4:2635-2862(-)
MVKGPYNWQVRRGASVVLHCLVDSNIGMMLPLVCSGPTACLLACVSFEAGKYISTGLNDLVFTAEFSKGSFKNRR